MGKKKRSEIRTSRKAEILGTLSGWVMKIWCATLRYEVEYSCVQDDPAPRIYLLWHSRIFVMPATWARTLGRRRKCVVLTSASHDGTILARAMKVFSLGAVRGSSSRRGVAALIGVKKTLDAGVDVCITPDGPRGPRHVLQPGAVKAAEFSGAGIVPIHVRCHSSWKLGTWDRLEIPKPFSTVSVTYGETLAVPRGLDETAFEATRARIEEILRSGVSDP